MMTFLPQFAIPHLDNYKSWREDCMHCKKKNWMSMFHCMLVMTLLVAFQLMYLIMLCFMYGMSLTQMTWRSYI